MRTQRCTIAWVKAHLGIEENEAADEATRKGAENKTNTTYNKKTIPAGISKAIIDSAIRTEWKENWQTAPHNNHTKLL